MTMNPWLGEQLAKQMAPIGRDALGDRAAGAVPYDGAVREIPSGRHHRRHRSAATATDIGSTTTIGSTATTATTGTVGAGSTLAPRPGRRVVARRLGGLLIAVGRRLAGDDRFPEPSLSRR
jgi:hypothetical protein